jgi:TMEM199 family protein
MLSVKQINRQLIAVAQFVFSVISGFFFGFLGLELIIGGMDFGFRLLLGIICALVIALAEIYFLAKRLNEELPVENFDKEYPLPSDKVAKKTN